MNDCHCGQAKLEYLCVLRTKLAKWLGHNYYGEPHGPTILYIFPIVILGTIACNVGLLSIYVSVPDFGCLIGNRTSN